jgi:twinkle protein
MDLPKIEGDTVALTARGIPEEICKRFHYTVGKVPLDYPVSNTSAIGAMKGKTVHIESYYDADGTTLVGQKFRDRDKNFAGIGDTGSSFFGRHTVKAGGKALVITEGAIDAMSYAVMRKGWPVLSIPNGSQSAKKVFKANLEFLESFEKVIVCFDNDEPGRDAVESVKGLLSPGKLHVASLPEEYKDLNEALLDGDFKAAMQAVLNAESIRPDGIVTVDDVMEEALKPIEMGLPWFLPELTEATYGRRYGEIYGLGAGTGVGKTDVLTEQVAFDCNVLDLNVGILFLEQKPAETVKRVAGKIANRRFHVPDGKWTNEELIEAAGKLSGKMVLYDSFGETEWQNVKSRIRFMHHAHDIRIFYVDHLTAMADTADEKGSLELIMKEMAGLANELSLIITFVSHLTTPDGTPHEEGGRVTIRHFKGSRSIGFWAYFLFGLERDQQSEDESERHTTTFRVLKDRYTGQATGLTFEIGYDPETGRIIPPHSVGFATPKPPSQSDTAGF